MPTASKGQRPLLGASVRSRFTNTGVTVGLFNWGSKAASPGRERKNVTIEGMGNFCAVVSGAPPNVQLSQMTAGACPIVDPPIGTEPPGRMRTGTCDYPNIPGDGTRRNVDLTRFAAVLGHATSTDPERPWPGTPGAVVAVLSVPATGYIAMAFQVTDPSRYCNIGLSTYYNALSHQVIASVSATPGDFNPATAVTVTPARGPGDTLLRIVGAPHTNGAPCVVGRTYYLNVKFAGNPSSPHTLALTNQVGNQP